MIEKQQISDSYDNYIETKLNYKENIINAVINQMCLLYESHIKIDLKLKDYWIGTFKDEAIVLDNFKIIDYKIELIKYINMFPFILEEFYELAKNDGMRYKTIIETLYNKHCV